MKPHWVLNPKSDKALSIASELNIHPVVASILLRRGLKNSSGIFSFLNPRLEDLESPFAFPDMSKAVERIRAAITRKEKVIVYGDYDVDGITGSAILYPILKKMGVDVEVYIPHRMNEGYGLNQETLEKLLKKKFKLLITVDNGITGVEPIRFLAERGVDTIVVDHHLPKEKLPPAYAFIGANAGGQTEPSSLAACGLAFKLGWALLGSFKEVEDCLDLVAVGTVADMAPVTGENRILLKYGLSILSKTKRVGLKALMDEAGVGSYGVSYRDIAFGLGPRINASGRMGSPENALKLLVTQNALEARNLAQLLEEGNRDRQRVESDAFEEALEQVEMNDLKDTEKILVLESPRWHEGVLGIVASRLVERYQRPSIVISLKEKIGKGSGRSLPHFSLFDSVLKCEDLLINFGGHAQACGLTIKNENIALFRKKLNDVVPQDLSFFQNTSKLSIDEEVSLAALDIKFLKDLEKLAPFGPGNRKPLFLSRGLRLKGMPKKRGKDTLQCWMADTEGKAVCEMIGFRSYARWQAAGQKKSFDVVYQPTLKNFNGIESIQLSLEDWD